MSNQSVRSLSNDLVVLTARLVREVRRSYDADYPAAGIRVLSLLDELGPATVSALAVADRCTQPTMSGLVRGLVDKGWLQRDPHPDDARASLVSMTPEGQRELTALRRRNATWMASRIEASDHTPEDLATAVAVLTDLLGHR